MSFDLNRRLIAEGQIRFESQGGDTIIEVNTAGTGGAEMEITLIGTFTLTAVDFIL